MDITNVFAPDVRSMSKALSTPKIGGPSERRRGVANASKFSQLILQRVTYELSRGDANRVGSDYWEIDDLAFVPMVSDHWMWLYADGRDSSRRGGHFIRGKIQTTPPELIKAV